MTKKIARKKQPNNFLDFNHRRLTKKAREYIHEMVHLTNDMLVIIRRANKELAICKEVIKNIGSKTHNFKIDSFNECDSFFGLKYHIENFIYRTHAYRDKYCMLLNQVFKFGYPESEMGLYNKLIENEQIKLNHLDTEMKKFESEEFKECLNIRKIMSHRIYYKIDRVNPYFMPEVTPKDVGFYKASIAWRKNINKEVLKINKCMEKVFDINIKTAEKLLRYLDNNK